MPKINVLGFDVANLIAAGEVVDRPASAVKELLENSIDAGATVVTVEIKSGGTRSIRVSDNGCGIGAEDLPLAVLRHATSKICTAADLAAIGTLGFRGEALAAIAAVTKLRIYSKLSDSNMGNMLQCEGGEIISLTEAGCSAGTTVIAEELFYNVPARRKFLKKDATETAAVTAAVEKIAISAPGVSIKYIADGEVRFMTAGDGNLYSAIYAVLGKQIASRTLYVDREENGIRVGGYISEPDFVRSKRSLELFFINGRYVLSRTASAALEQAYSARIPNEKFPFCSLNIELNPEAVDVNVHPSKLEVKFSNERLIFEAVYYAVLTALESSGTRPELKIKSHEISADNSPSGEKDRSSRTSEFQIFESGRAITREEANELLPPAPDGSEIGHQVNNTQDSVNTEHSESVFSGIMAGYSTPAFAEEDKHVYKAFVDPRKEAGIKILSSPNAEINLIGRQNQISIDDSYANFANDENLELPANNEEWENSTDAKIGSSDICDSNGDSFSAIAEQVPDYTILGEAYNCYIIVQLEDRLVLIDKHAAHERIIFDTLQKNLQYRLGGTQTLMFPLKITLTEIECSALSEFDEKIRGCGFDFQTDDKCAVLHGIPNIISTESAADMFQTMVASLAENTGTVESIGAEYFERALYRASCKAAIKGGRVYGQTHLKWICDRVLGLSDEGGKVIKTCPHGRPVAFEIKKSSIERQFSRIV